MKIDPQIMEIGLSLDLQGWNSTEPVFLSVIEEVKPKVIIEVGTWKGASAIHMATLSDATIYCVDTWLGSEEHHINPEFPMPMLMGFPALYHQFCFNVQTMGVADKIEALPVPSLIGARIFKRWEKKAQLIYLDGSHDILDVTMDMMHYWPLVEKGGIMFGDDYDWCSVEQAVETFGKANSLTPEIRNGKHWIFRK